uniref:DUF2442 domain-containing protein n=1 Tax=Candidatus Kentrum sp. SD TaxID=2126332 RepID=A0A451BPR4_9GAMM|nr:MAG: Protein of unknown function (DUF2442) [Candidatus Kentron sp. SD]
MNPRVKKVVPLSDYRLLIEFTNDEQGIYDCGPLLDFGVFRELKDKSYFGRVRAHDGAVAWPHEQDICPDTLYLDSTKHTEPTSPWNMQ